MIVKVDVPRPQSIALDEFIVSRRSLVLRVASQHALKAHADALDILYRTPSLLTKKIETDDAIRVYVRVYRYGSVGQLDEGHFGRFYDNVSPLASPDQYGKGILYGFIPIGYWSPNLKDSLKVLSRYSGLASST